MEKNLAQQEIVTMNSKVLAKENVGVSGPVDKSKLDLDGDTYACIFRKWIPVPKIMFREKKNSNHAILVLLFL